MSIEKKFYMRILSAHREAPGSLSANEAGSWLFWGVTARRITPGGDARRAEADVASRVGGNQPGPIELYGRLTAACADSVAKHWKSTRGNANKAEDGSGVLRGIDAAVLSPGENRET